MMADCFWINTSRIVATCFAILLLVIPGFPGVAGSGSKPDLLMLNRVASGVVYILANKNVGAGCIIDGDLIVTNYHVVKNAKGIIVAFRPKNGIGGLKASMATTATVYFHDEVIDLAFLKITARPDYAIPLRLADSKSITPGIEVYAIGHPMGRNWAFSHGKVSKTIRKFKWQSVDLEDYTGTVVQTDAVIVPGYSGGPLVNALGEMIGLNSFKGNDSTLNFALSVSEISKYGLVEPGRVISLPGRLSPLGYLLHNGSSPPKARHGTRNDSGYGNQLISSRI